ncbi:heparin lyase I family protein [Amycolatopsis anabasis]|uniref:heparin lyase I family protein n=1 Tax=Amycolatopsis anabasis TaxID=1840409 RepID=UPI00131C7394|nr:heparin lyase I family protein [Amycolatopsis anabasis]
MWRSVTALLATTTLLLLGSPPADAALLWNGDAALGKGVFANIGGECASPGDVTAVDDADRGKVWRYRKPGGLNRCESRGIKVGGKEYTFRNGQTYYLGWSSKLTSTVNNNANFQWKSYGNHTQNYPVVLKVIDGRFALLQRQPNETRIIWRTPLAANTWHRVVLGLHLSDQLKGGWVELYYDGVQQTFDGGSKRWPCRTFDDENHPKWGVYGARDDAVTQFVDDLKIGTAYSDVAGG